MSTQLWEVIAVQDRWIKVEGGKKVKAEEGYVVHRSFQQAEGAAEAIADVKTYHMLPGTKYNSIRAEPA